MPWFRCWLKLLIKVSVNLLHEHPMKCRDHFSRVIRQQWGFLSNCWLIYNNWPLIKASSRINMSFPIYTAPLPYLEKLHREVLPKDLIADLVSVDNNGCNAIAAQKQPRYWKSKFIKCHSLEFMLSGSIDKAFKCMQIIIQQILK